jgi:hypothetical protein
MRPEGIDHNTMEHLLGTDSRNPAAKHRILEMYVEHGFEPPDTPVMALHRGRVDLLESHLARDPICSRARSTSPMSTRSPLPVRGAVHGSGDAGARDDAPPHRAYFDELEIGQWLMDKGMDPDARAAIDADGFGGYTALFSTVVSQRNFWVNLRQGRAG